MVDFGTQWLNSNPTHPDSKDVGLAMALAYCDLASDTLANDESGVATCCNDLEIAVELLSHFNAAPELQSDIKGTLKVACCLHIAIVLAITFFRPECAFSIYKQLLRCEIFRNHGKIDWICAVPISKFNIIGVQELGPQFILEQFALPDDGTNAEKKAKAMKQLRALVWEVDEELNLSPFLGDREAFLEQARANLTAAQQVFEWLISQI